MAKQNKTTSKQKKNKASATKSTATNSWWRNTVLVKTILFTFSFLLYANTFQHDFALDDAIVITDNKFTKQGLAGLGDLFSYDTFRGFFGEDKNLVAGGRYRPLTPAMFAVEYAIFGDNAPVMHVLNAVWYGATVVVLYAVLLLLFQRRAKWDKQLKKSAVWLIPLLAAVLFAAHPLHTEAVANIKGRDEIIALLGSLGALWLVVKGGTRNLLLASACFFLALLAKENTITFLGVAPLAFYIFTKEDVGGIVQRVSPLLIAGVLFLILRYSVIGWGLGEQPKELMNNPYLKLEQGRWEPFDAGEKAATITYTLGKYAQLLVVPTGLTHDYYPRHIDIMTFGDWQVLLSLLLYLALLGYALWGLVRRRIDSFAILYYLGTLFIVSNIVFPVGTNMSERFLFMPSVGFTLLVAWSIMKFIDKQSTALSVGLALTLVFAVGTFLRNPAWHDNYTLFTTDVEVSQNSAKLRNAVAGELSVQWGALPPAQRTAQTNMLQKALVHINEAIRIHPTYQQAYFIKGNILNYLKEFDASIQAYGQALQINPDYNLAQDNLNITYRDAGRHYGEQMGDLQKSLQYLELAYAAMPEDYETIRLLGVANGIAGRTNKAIELFQKNTQLQFDNARAWFDLGTAYYNGQQNEAANGAFQRARQLDPDIERKVREGIE